MALLSARSNDGYRFVVDDDGPDRVAVRFESDEASDGGDDEGLVAWCRDGEPTDAGRDGRGPGGHRGGDDGDITGDDGSGSGRRAGRGG
jgi:hypothetical protein